jgi:hypothetical protein
MMYENDCPKVGVGTTGDAPVTTNPYNGLKADVIAQFMELLFTALAAASMARKTSATDMVNPTPENQWAGCM